MPRQQGITSALQNRGVFQQTVNKISGIIGAGIYVIYYTGKFPAYAPIASKNLKGAFKCPIYVGKAIPKGGRKGGLTLDSAKGTSLFSRLRQHETTIKEATNLDIRDFHFRHLVVDDIWIPLGENMLIETFQPLWNLVIDGFGNKTPGKGRATQKRSSWDVLHPGRKYVDKLSLAANPLTETNIIKRIEDFFAGRLSEANKLPPEQEA